MSNAALASVAIRLVQDRPDLTIRQAADAMGITPSVINYHWRRRDPGRHLRGPHHAFSTTTLERSIEPFAELCDIMLDQLEGKMSAGALFAATEAVYGNAARRVTTQAARDRRLFRALRRLVDTGLVRRHGKQGSGSAVYRRTS